MAAKDLGAFTSPEVAGRSWTLLIPMGSTEQHGPHLPLDTDSRVALEVAMRAASGVDRVLVAPVIPISASGEHAGFAGTLSVGADVVARLVVEIVRTAGPEFAMVVVVSGHGGNAAALTGAREVCAAEGRLLEVWWPNSDDGDAHAGRTETSVMLAIAPDVVRSELFEVGATAPLAELAEQLRAGGVAAVSPNGILGDPAGATSTEGERVLRAWVGEVAELLQR